jgi:hypothetical protein
MDSEFDVSVHPEILFQKDFDLTKISVGNVKFNGHYDEIDFYEIVGVSVKDYDCSDDNFTKRLEKLQTHDGHIDLAGGIMFGITNQHVTEIRLKGKYFKQLSGFGKPEILAAYGKPDKILLDENMWEKWSFDREILIFTPKQLCFFIDPPESGKIVEVRLGTWTIHEENYVVQS